MSVCQTNHVIVMLIALTQWAALSVFAELGFKEMVLTAQVKYTCSVFTYVVSLQETPLFLLCACKTFAIAYFLLPFLQM